MNFKSKLENIEEIRRQLNVIFEQHNCLYMTGDMCLGHSMIGLWKSNKPRFGISRFDGPNGSFKSSLNVDGEFEEDFTYDVPWCIDLCSGEMELPTLGLTLPLEEWAVM